MTQYLFLPIGAENQGTNSVLQNLNVSPFIDKNYSRVFSVAENEGYYKQYVIAKDYEGNKEAVNVLKSTAEADVNVLQKAQPDAHFGKIIISDLKDAPFALHNLEASPAYLSHVKEVAELDIHNGKDYSSSVNCQYIQLYNAFHQDNPISLVGAPGNISEVYEY